MQSIPKHKKSTVQEDSAVHTQTQHEDRHRVYAMQALWLPAKPDIISSLCYFTADCMKRVHQCGACTMDENSSTGKEWRMA